MFKTQNKKLNQFVSSFFIRHLIFSAQVFSNILKKYFLVYGFLFVTLVSLSSLAQYIAYEEEFMIFSLILPLIISFFSTLVVGSYSLFVLPYLVQKDLNRRHIYERQIPQSFISYVRNFSLWLKEIIKVVSVSYLWMILFIVPGVVKFLRCAFVSYITLIGFEKSHPRRTSHQYTKGKMKYISLLFFTFVGGTIACNFLLPHFLSLNIQMVGKFMIESVWFLFFSSFMSIVFQSMYLEEEEARNPIQEPLFPKELSL